MSEESPGGLVQYGQYAAGSVVAGYRLEQQIGQGGMAVVFRAHDPRLNRDVALKILAPNLAYDDAFRKRFIRESRAAAALDDPHVIPVFEAGETDGVLFIAMRFARGGDVRSLLDRVGPLPPGRAVDIVAQAASALDAAHEGGLVHRDVKPANMLLDAGGDRRDHVYLSDFGLSKMSLALTGLTASGQFLGTLEYTAPEQILGQKVDGRADQYGLACATLELFTGMPPFRRDQPMAMMYAHVNEPPPLLSEVRPELGDVADDVLERALAKLPEERYGSCREFAAALRVAFQLGAFGAENPAGPALAAAAIIRIDPPGVPSSPPQAPATPVMTSGPPTQTASHPSQPPSSLQEPSPNVPVVTSGPPTQTASHPSQPQLTPVPDPSAGPLGGQATGQPGTPPAPAGPSGPPAAVRGEQATAPPGPPAPAAPAGGTQPATGLPNNQATAPPGPPAPAAPAGGTQPATGLPNNQATAPPGPPAPAGPAQPATGLPDGQATAQPGPPGQTDWEERSGGVAVPPLLPPVEAAWQPERDPAGAGTEPRAGSGTGPQGEPATSGRPWWRSPVLAAAASIIIVLGIAGVYFLTGQGSGQTGGKTGGTTGGRLDSHRSHVHHAATGLVAPGCSTALPKLTPFSKVATRTFKVGTSPYALQHSTNGRYTFVTVHNGIAVLRNDGGLSLTLVRTVPLRGAGAGLETTTDGDYLVAAVGSGAAVLSVSGLEDGAANPVLGMLTSPHGSGAVTPLLSADGQYLFVALAGSNDIAVFNFGLAEKSGFSAAHFIGDIPLGVQPTGMRLAVDQNYLYATSLQRTAVKAPSEGTLSVIDVPQAETDPAKSVKVTVNAGCSPERVYPTGNTVWITARDSNAVLAFSASDLLSNPSHALLAVVRIGPGPVGLTPLTDGRIVITDSGDAGTHDGSGNLAVISGDSALANKPSLLGVVPVDGMPYQLTRTENHGTLLVTDMATGQLLALSATSMP